MGKILTLFTIPDSKNYVATIQVDYKNIFKIRQMID
jgi:hypothetical protein